MCFKKWMLEEGKSLSPQDSIFTKNQEVVNGWRVYYNTPPEFIENARNIAQKGTATLQSLNVRKSLRIPVVFVYNNHNIHNGLYSYKDKTPYVVVELYFTRDPVGVLVHEIGHAIYTRLSDEQQKQIDYFAKQYPNISSLGSPISSKLRAGEEWFPECIRLLARGGGLPEDNPSNIPREVGITIKNWISDTNTAPQSNKFYATDERPRYTPRSSKTTVQYNPNAPVDRGTGKAFDLGAAIESE